MRARQPFLSDLFKPCHEHGGSLRTGRRKVARPIDPKRPVHVVLKSERATGALSLLLRSKQIRELIDRVARQFEVRIYQFANAGNHLHLLARAKTRKGLRNFFRVIAGQIAQLMTGSRKGRRVEPFWSAPVYTRIVEWGRAFGHARSYVLRNELEASGLIPFRPRAHAPPG
jgi:REP element-mobilizing transposase RayT